MTAPMEKLRPGDIQIDLPPEFDAGLYFIGRIHTPFATLADCPKQGRGGDVIARIELDQRWESATKDLALFSHVILLYWLHSARRDLVVQSPRRLPAPRGTFALRSPVRPNPIGISAAALLAVDGTTLHVRGIECLDGTPLLDIKPYLPSTDSVPDATTPELPRA